MAEKDFNRDLAENLVKYRKLHMLSQAELAAAIGYSDKSVSKWERGAGTPDIYTLRQISEIYGITVSELIGQTAMSKETAERFKAVEKSEKAREKAKKKALEKARKQKHREKKQSSD